MSTQYPNQAGMSLGDALGWRPPLARTWNATGDGVTDDAPALTEAISDIVANGGAELRLPRGEYLVNSPIEIPAGVSKIRIVGEGESTVIKRGANMPDGQGVFDVSGEDIEFENFVVDGDVTTSVGVLFSDIGYDPMHNTMTKNSSFWVHGGAKRIVFRNVTVRHTGGYSILIDATTGDIEDVEVLECLIENNRPHLFGTGGGDLSYGSWTSGIHYQSDGTNYCVRRLLVEGCTFRRNTGVAVWGHLYALNKLHEQVRIIDNDVVDNGYHGLQLGGVTGGVVADNKIRRIGYICSDDTSASTPKYLAGMYNSAIDFSGLVMFATITGNSVMSANGDCFDLDGLAYSVVSNNTCIIPLSGQEQYTEDKIDQIGPGGTGDNWTYGMQTGNTNDDEGGQSLVISDNVFVNMGGGAIRLYAARNCTVRGNSILHSANANWKPITMGNMGAGSGQRAYGNNVSGNKIDWTPAVVDAAIWEDDQGGTYPFQATDVNVVAGNEVRGNAYEFLRNSASNSVTKLEISTNDPTVTDVSKSIMAHELSGASAVWKLYMTEGTVLRQILHAQRDNALLNVSNHGGAGTGIFATANRTTSVWGDAVVTGKLFGDSMLVLAATTYADADANLLGDTYGIIRWDNTAKIFKQSVSVAAGARVWTTFGATPGGSTTHVQYNNAGVLAGSANNAWNNTDQVLSITGKTGTAGLNVYTSFIYSKEGLAVDAAATATNAIQAPGGGITVRYLNGTTSLSLIGDTEANAGLSISGMGRLFFDSSLNKFRVSQHGGAYVDLLGAGPGGSTTHVQYNNAGVLAGSANNAWNNTDQVLSITGKTGTAGLNVNTSYVYSAEGFNTTSSAWNAIQAAASGAGAYLNRVTIDTGAYLKTLGTGTTPSNPTGYGCLAHRTGATYWYWNGASWAYVDLSAVVTSVNSLSGAVSITAGTGVTVTPSSPNVQISIGQAVATTSTVTFGTVTSAGIFQSQASGSSTTFANTNGNFQVDGNGNISAAAVISSTGASGGINVTAQTSVYSIQTAGGMRVGSGGSTNGRYYVDSGIVIDENKSFVGTGGVVCPTANVGALGFAVYYGGGWVYGHSGPTNFTSADGKTVTVVGGLVSNVV